MSKSRWPHASKPNGKQSEENLLKVRTNQPSVIDVSLNGKPGNHGWPRATVSKGRATSWNTKQLAGGRRGAGPYGLHVVTPGSVRRGVGGLSAPSLLRYSRNVFCFSFSVIRFSSVVAVYNFFFSWGDRVVLPEENLSFPCVKLTRLKMHHYCQIHVTKHSFD